MSRPLRALPVPLIAFAISLGLLRGLDELPDWAFNLRLFVSLVSWSLGFLLLGVFIASFRRKIPSVPICVGAVIGVAPTLLYCLALLTWNPETDLATSQLLSAARIFHRPLQLITPEWSAFAGISSSHASPTAMAQSWLVLTAANAVMWTSVGALLQIGISSYSKRRTRSALGDE